MMMLLKTKIGADKSGSVYTQRHRQSRHKAERADVSEADKKYCMYVRHKKVHTVMWRGRIPYHIWYTVCIYTYKIYTSRALLFCSAVSAFSAPSAFSARTMYFRINKSTSLHIPYTLLYIIELYEVRTHRVSAYIYARK